MDIYTRAFLHLLKWEGGFVHRPSEPAGSSMHGVTRLALERWRGAPVSVSALRQLTQAEASAFYRETVWTPLRCQDMGWATGLVLFDAGVTHGGEQAVRLLQAALGLSMDGVAGDATVRAVRRQSDEMVVEQFAAERLVYYSALPTFPQFGPTWTRRMISLVREALHPQGLVEVAA